MLSFYLSKNGIFFTLLFVVLNFLSNHFVSKILKRPVYEKEDAGFEN